jgi:hypothetical protein
MWQNICYCVILVSEDVVRKNGAPSCYFIDLFGWFTMSRIFPGPGNDVPGFTIQCKLCLSGQSTEKSLKGPIMTVAKKQRLLLNVMTQRKRSWLVILRYAVETSFDLSAIQPEDFCQCSHANIMIIARPRPS